MSVNLARLLEQNDKVHASDGLIENFGDDYLMANNRSFSKLRKLALREGFKFSLDRNDFYLALPLSQLDMILADKKIPYMDNVTVLRSVEKRIKGGALWDEVCDNLKKNHLFHETCHAVARQHAKRIFAEPAKVAEPIGVLRILIEESFANTSELLSVVEAADDVHRIFLEWNSYICMFSDRTNLKNAMSEFGEVGFRKFMLYSYLHANFLANHLEEKAFQRILRLASLTPTMKQSKVLKALAKISFQLNPRFREVTTGFYLRLSGAQKPLAQLLDFDFLALIENERRLQDLIHVLSGLI